MWNVERKRAPIIRTMDVWHVDLALGPRAIEREARLLDAGEHARLARLRGEPLRRRFIASHAALRRILAARLRRRAEDLRFWHEPAGRPRLRPEAGTAPVSLHFSLSHAGDHALVAVSGQRPVGIDLECEPAPPSLADDLRPHLAPVERDALARLHPSGRARAACRCWVRKEALAKAAGCGLAGDLSRLAVSCGDEARLIASDWPGIEAGAWSLASLDRPGLWVAAVATHGPRPQPRLHAWRWDAIEATGSAPARPPA